MLRSHSPTLFPSRRRPCLVAAAVGLAVSVAGAAEVELNNEVGGNGSLRITTDAFGSFADAFQNGPQWVDFFDPSPDPDQGELPENYATFSTNLFFYVDPSGTGNGTHRGIASSHLGIQTTYPDGNIVCTVDTENTVDNLPASTSSTFSCAGDGVDFSVSLTQTIGTLSPGPNGESRAQLEQTYVITNNAGLQQIIINKHIDEDLLWGGDATNDLVGVDFAEIERPQVYAQDNDLVTAALVFRTRDDMTLDPNTVEGSFIYYVGKQNLAAPPGNPDFPGGDCPVHDFGTDTEIWDNFGVPNCWKNFVPGVGYNVPGISPQIAGDTMMGLQVTADLDNGESYEVSFQTLYGFRPEPTLVIPPALTTQTIEFGDDGCGLFLWNLKNVNPTVAGEGDPITIEEFYIDVEAGDGAGACNTMTPPDGWNVTLCQGPTNGHALYKFDGGTPIITGGSVHGRYRVETNDVDETTNQTTNIVVPPLSIVLHAAQGGELQPDAECNFNFGPSTSGEWSIQTTATAFLPVPALSTATKTVLAVLILLAGTGLVARSRREVAP